MARRTSRDPSLEELMILRYAVRGLRRKPGFAIAVVLTLALGIGANATMFGVIDRLLFRPPAYMQSPDRVHRVNLAVSTERDGEFITGTMSYKRYVELAEWSKAFDVTAAVSSGEAAIGTGEDAREMDFAAVSASFWKLFDAPPALGRYFTPDEDHAPEGTAVVVLGYGYWQTRYGGRTDILGQPLQIGSTTYTIIGVARKDFDGAMMASQAAFVPITAHAHAAFAGGSLFGGTTKSTRPSYHAAHNIQWLEMLARRKPGVSVETATADLTNAYRRSYTEQKSTQASLQPPELAKPRAIASPLLRERGPRQGNESKVAVWLVGVAGIVLLIACANVSNLLLARAFSRRREVAVRRALGVSRSRLIGQLAVESLLLAVLGAALGLLLAQWGGGILRSALIENVDWPSTLGDTRVLAFTLGATLVSALLAGLAPALHTGRGDLAATLKAGAREGTYQRSRLRVALLVTQGALSVVLLVGAGLFVRSLHNVRSLDLGYDGPRVMYAEMKMRGVSLDSVGSDALRQELVRRAAALPVVEAAARTITVPFWSTITEALFVAGIDSVDRLGDFYYNAVSTDYFKTMGTALRRGRTFTAGDTRTSPRVMVVSDAMGRKLWPGRDPIGQCVRIGADTMPCTEVVGVVADIRNQRIGDEPGASYYVPIDQLSRGMGGGVFIRARTLASAQAETVRRQLQRAMPGASYITVTPLDDILGRQTRSWTLGATMFSVFGVLALLVAAVGLYSVIAYNVAQRTHELGVRVALGARTPDVVRLVVGEGVRVSLVGIAFGTIAALVAVRWIGPLLFGVSPKDPAVFSVVGATLFVVAILASVIPAWRASRVEPTIALRAD